MPQLRSIESRIKRAIKRFAYWEQRWYSREQFGYVQWYGPEEQVLSDDEFKAMHKQSFDRLVRNILSIAGERK